MFAGAMLATAQPQVPAPPPPLDPLLQIMITQPSIDVTSNVQITATFDPPAVRPGAKAIYRVTFNALSDSIEWPDKFNTPAELRPQFSARGQMLMPADGKLKPQTTINYHVHPTAEGSFTVPSFTVRVYGRSFAVPAARLMVSAQAPATAPQSLELELDRTNVYLGQPLRLRALMKGSAGNVVQGIHDLRFNGEGFLADQGTARQSIRMIPQAGGNLPAYIYETTISPLATGDITVSAQGFTAGNQFSGPIIIQGQVTIPGGLPQFLLVDSEPVVIHVHPLSRAGELPGFTGAMGKFSVDPPRLSASRVKAGELVKLFVTFRGEGNFERLIPPPPPSATNWQIFAAQPGAGPPPPGTTPVQAGNFAGFTYTLIPLSPAAKETPAIPFSYFDPDRGTYVDLTIPPTPIMVTPGDSVMDSRTLSAMNAGPDESEKKPKLGDLTEKPGWTASSLTPLQQRGWFVGVQLVPLAGFLALWKWDRHRRFLEQHPDVVQRRRARRALQRERRKLRPAITAGDENAYIAAAVSALQIAVAPHHAAEPRALVARDILESLNGNASARETVRTLFAAADESEFSNATAGNRNLIAQHASLEKVLNELEAKL